MTMEKLRDRAQQFGGDFLHNYARSRRAAAWVSAVLFVLFLGAAQFLSYEIALLAEYAEKNALILAAVPFAGPVALGVQCAMTGGAASLFRALFLLGALARATVFLLLGTHFHDLRKRALCVQAEREEAAAQRAESSDRLFSMAAPSLPGQPPVILRPGTGPAPLLKKEAAPVPARAAAAPSTAPQRPEVFAKAASPSAPAPVSVRPEAPAARPVVLPVSRTTEKTAPPARPAPVITEQPRAVVSPAGPAKASVPETAKVPAGMASRPAASSAPSAHSAPSAPSASSPSGGASLQKAEEEYQRAMQDVWALLQKKDK